MSLIGSIPIKDCSFNYLMHSFYLSIFTELFIKKLKQFDQSFSDFHSIFVNTFDLMCNVEYMFLMMTSHSGRKRKLDRHLKLIACVTCCAYSLMASLQVIRHCHQNISSSLSQSAFLHGISCLLYVMFFFTRLYFCGTFCFRLIQIVY